jgi:hypothetical protein
MNLQQQDRFYQMMTRLKAQGNSSSRAASANAPVIKPPCDIIVSDNPDRVNNNNNSKAASPSTQYQTVVNEKKYDMGGSSTGEQVYQCGTHNFETKNLKEFNEHVTRTHDHNDSGGKAASAFVQENKLQDIIRFQKSNGRL